MSKLTKEQFNDLIYLLELIAPRHPFIKATEGIEIGDVATAIKIMMEGTEPHDPDMIIINPWTYEVLKSAGVWDDE